MTISGAGREAKKLKEHIEAALEVLTVKNPRQNHRLELEGARRQGELKDRLPVQGTAGWTV